MKKILSLILACVMLTAVLPSFAETASETSSEEGGLLSLLSSLVSGSPENPEGGRLSRLLDGLKERLGGGEGSSLLSSLMEKLRGVKDEKLPGAVEALKQKFGGLLSGITGGAEHGEGAGLSSLLGGFLGGTEDGTEGGRDILPDILSSLFSGTANVPESSGSSSTQEYFDGILDELHSTPEYQEELAREDALKAYLIEEYGELLEKGDEQIAAVSAVIIVGDGEKDQELGYFSLTSYTADGKDLKQAGYAGRPELLTFTRQEDGSFRVTGAAVAEEGEKQEDSLRKICDAYGIPFDSYLPRLLWKDYDEVSVLRDFLKEHPEYERMEYRGEMKTLEELEKIQDTLFGETSAAYDAAVGE